MAGNHEKPTILHLITSLDSGGTERQLSLVIPRLTSFNHVIVCLQKWGSVGEDLKKSFPVYYLPTPHLFKLNSAMALKKIVNEHRPVVMITYLPFADIFGRIWKKYCRIPMVVCFLRSTMREWRYFPLVLLNIATQRLVDHFFAVSDTVKTFYEKWGLGKNQTSVIYNGIEINPVRNSISNGIKEKIDEKPFNFPEFPDGTIILGYVANLRKERGHIILLKSLQILKKGGVRAHLILVGDGSYRPALETTVKRLNLEENVTFLGKRADVRELFGRFTIYVHPSLYEGMSNALLESMAAGCAIITTDIPENRELLKNGYSALLVPPKDPKKLSEEIINLIFNQELRKMIGENAKKDAQKFGIDKTASRLDYCLQKFISQ